jgi:hypothetical protein
MHQGNRMLKGASIVLLCVGLIATAPTTQVAFAQQPNAAPRPPISIKGWRHDNSPLGLHTFSCAQPVCPSPSKLVYQLLPPNLQMTFEQYRRHAEPLNAEMSKRNTHGVRYELLGVVDGSKTAGDLTLRLFKTRRRVIERDGAERIMIDGYVLGSRYMVSITSTADDEKTADANFMQFAAPLWLLADDKLERQR